MYRLSSRTLVAGKKTATSNVKCKQHVVSRWRAVKMLKYLQFPRPFVARYMRQFPKGGPATSAVASSMFRSLLF